MPRPEGSTTFAVISLGAAVAACQSAPAQYADTGVHATYHAAATGVSAVRATGGELYTGAGRAFRAPLHDLNMMQDKIPPVLLRAETRPYDLTGVNSCNDVLNRVSELDLELGPDVDTPKQKKRTRVSRGADFAASTALDAAGSAAEHFIPMRGTIKQISGATRYENHVKHAVLAGETRRSFLKAVGMSHNCSWPAAPLEFTPVQVADVAAPWSAPVPAAGAGSGGGVALASLSGRPAATAAAVSSSPVATARPVTMANLSHSALSVPAPTRLAIPTPVTPAEAGQSWRPASRRSDLVEVSAPLAGASLQSTSFASTGSGSAAPWSAGFVSGAAPPPSGGRPRPSPRRPVSGRPGPGRPPAAGGRERRA